MKALAFAVFAALWAAPGFAQCVDVSDYRAEGAFTGVLQKETIAGPPNWESVAKGDRAMPTFFLRLPKNICAQDGGEFANPNAMFDRIHVSGSGDHPPWDWLNAHIGQQVTLRGHIFAASTAWHLAPLVMLLPKDWKPPS